MTWARSCLNWGYGQGCGAWVCHMWGAAADRAFLVACLSRETLPTCLHCWVCLPAFMPACIYVCLFTRLPANMCLFCLPACLSVCLSVCVPACLSVLLSAGGLPQFQSTVSSSTVAQGLGRSALPAAVAIAVAVAVAATVKVAVAAAAGLPLITSIKDPDRLRDG